MDNKKYATFGALVFLFLLIIITWLRRNTVTIHDETLTRYCVDIGSRLNDDIQLQRLLVIEMISNSPDKEKVMMKIAKNNTLLSQDLSYFLPPGVGSKVLSILNDKSNLLEDMYKTMLANKSDNLDIIVEEKFEIMRSLNVKMISLLIENDDSRSAVSYENLKRAFNERDLIIAVQGKEVIAGRYDCSIDILENVQGPSKQITTLLYQYCQVVPLK